MVTWKKWLRSNMLLLLTITSVFLGVAVGLAARKSNPSKSVIELVAFPGELFIRMLQMAILPLVTSSIMTGLATLDPKTSKRIFILSFSYYAFTTAVAIALGIILVVLIAPGYHTKLEASIESDGFANAEELAQITTADTLFDLLRNVFPENMAEACIKQYRTIYERYEQINERNETVVKFRKRGSYEPKMNIIGIITISVTAGIILGKMRDSCKSLIGCLSAIDQITMNMISMIMWYSPVGIACLVAGKLLEMADVRKTLSALALYMITVIVGFLIQMFILQPLFYLVLTRRNPITFMRGLIQVCLMAFVTASSAATLPINIRCCERNLHIDRRITRFVLPVGATVNMNGEALYEAVSAIFIAQLTGWHLNAVRLIVISVVATVGSVGAAAVPSAGVITLVIVLNAMGLSTRHIPMIIAVDWFIDRVRTSVNVIGDAFAAGVVHHYCRKMLLSADATTSGAARHEDVDSDPEETGNGVRVVSELPAEETDGSGNADTSLKSHYTKKSGTEESDSLSATKQDVIIHGISP